MSPTARSYFLRRGRVDHDFVGPGGGSPSGARAALWVLGPVRADRRRTDTADRLAGRRVDHLRVPGHGPVRGRDTRHRLHGGQDVLRHRLALVAAAATGPQLTGRERRFRAHDDVAPGGDLREQVVERLVHRVGQHERAGDEAHAEDDRERRERQSDLAGEQALDGRAEQRSALQRLEAVEHPLGGRLAHLVDDVPSARNTTRSA